MTVSLSRINPPTDGLMAETAVRRQHLAGAVRHHNTSLKHVSHSSLALFCLSASGHLKMSTLLYHALYQDILLYQTQKQRTKHELKLCAQTNPHFP